MSCPPLDCRPLSFSDRWIVREDKYYDPAHIMFNIDTGQMLDLEPLAFAICRLFQLNRCSASDVLSFFKIKGIDGRQEQAINHAIHILIEKKALTSDRLDTSGSIPETPTIVEPPRIARTPVATTPYDVEIHLTHSCNLRCRHCAYDAGRKLSEQLREVAWLDIADQLEAMAVLRVIVSGGEPLLHPGAAHILEKLSAKRMKIELLTNGTLISDRMANILSAPNISTSISLDGYKRETHDFMRGNGSYNRTIAALSRLSQSGATFHISTTIHKKNLDEISSLIEWAADANAASINFITLDMMGRAKQHSELSLDDSEIRRAAQLIDGLRELCGKIQIGFFNPHEMVYVDLGSVSNNERIYCTAGTVRMAIRSDGVVFPCVYGFFSDDRFAMGTVRSSPLQDIWNSEKWISFRGDIRLAEIDGCAECSLAPRCVIKVCRLRPYYDTGNFLGPPWGCLNRDTIPARQ